MWVTHSRSLEANVLMDHVDDDEADGDDDGENIK